MALVFDFDFRFYFLTVGPESKVKEEAWWCEKNLYKDPASKLYYSENKRMNRYSLKGSRKEDLKKKRRNGRRANTK